MGRGVSVLLKVIVHRASKEQLFTWSPRPDASQSCPESAILTQLNQLEL